MSTAELARALGGGALIGLGGGLLLVATGQVAGVSGVLDGALRPRGGAWRWCFLGGLVLGGLILRALNPALVPGPGGSPESLAFAGFIVGFGARLSNGCTSGHGVAGCSRLSRRSLVATTVFMTTGFATLGLWRALHG